MTIKWSDELIKDICDHIASGKSMLEVACLQGYPSAASMYRQLARDETFATAIARAREAQQDHEADLCVKMADEATNEDWQVVKLRIWARQWRAAKLAPKKYGDKVLQEHTGKDGGPIQTDMGILSDLPRNQREALRNAITTALDGSSER